MAAGPDRPVQWRSSGGSGCRSRRADHRHRDREVAASTQRRTWPAVTAQPELSATTISSDWPIGITTNRNYVRHDRIFC